MTSGSFENMPRAGSSPTYKRTAAIEAMMALKTMVCSMTRFVRSLSPEPTLCVIRATDEVPITSFNTSTSQKIEEKRVAPATALADTRPIHIRSTTS